jgi:ribosome biogenesis GTPase A
VETTIQWYPGHIAKLERELQPLLKQLDIIIEILDARIPRASSHRALSEKLREQKPVLLVLNKSDLADPYWTKQWVEVFKETYAAVIPFDSSTGKGKEQIIDAICRLGEPKFLQLEAKGLKRRALRTGVVGMPNVGKSTLVNTLVGRKKAKTGHRAGVTRTTQWVRIHPLVELLDTPGMIPPKLESQETGQLLASVYSVGDAAFDEEAITPFFLEQVELLYPGLLKKAFDLPDDAEISIEGIAKRRGLILPGGALDLRRTAQAVLKDYRHGKLGRITLERPETV